MPNMICEACGKSPARYGDILCNDCAHYYAILRELVDQHPDLVLNELDKLKEIFQWREKQIQLGSRRLTAV